MITTGDQTPALMATLSDGRQLNLAAPGAPLILFFYPKDDTSGCTAEAKDFTTLAPDFTAAGALVVGVSRDAMAKHDKFIAKYDLRVPLASDEDGVISDAFGTWVQKSMYGRKYMGMERSTFLIDPAGKIVGEWRKIKVPGHAQAMLAAVRAL